MFINVCRERVQRGLELKLKLNLIGDSASAYSFVYTSVKLHQKPIRLICRIPHILQCLRYALRLIVNSSGRRFLSSGLTGPATSLPDLLPSSLAVPSTLVHFLPYTLLRPSTPSHPISPPFPPANARLAGFPSLLRFLACIHSKSPAIPTSKRKRKLRWKTEIGQRAQLQRACKRRIRGPPLHQSL